ncbi:MAG TPA: hypothetical protein VNO22_01675 [Planctomycetota bacterium]|nr:hypothetical protein [Planctomycetota bacterium]
MRLSFREWCMELRSHPVHMERKELLDTASTADLLLCESRSEATLLFEVDVFGCTAERAKFRIGVLSQAHGAVPHMFPIPGTDRVMVGFDRRVVGVDLRTHKQAFEHELETVFHSFYHAVDHRIVMALHEIGILALSEEGQRLWDFGKDVITAAEVGRDSIRLTFMDSPPIVLRIRDGKVA